MCALHLHAYTRDKVDVLVSRNSYGESIRDKFFCRLELERDRFTCNLFTQRVKLDVDVLRARVIHMILGQRDAYPFRKKTCPVVDRRVSRSPAQLASVNPISFLLLTLLNTMIKS